MLNSLERVPILEAQLQNEKSIKDKAVFMSGKNKELAKAKDIELKLRKKHC